MSEWLVSPEDWGKAVAAADGPQLVVAGPGGGKTEFLVRRARHLIENGVPSESILLLSFSRRGARDLRDRVVAGLGRSVGQLPASTFHSLAMRIVEAHGAAGAWAEAPTVLTSPEHVALVSSLLADEDPARWPLPYRGLLGSQPFAEEVADFGLRAAEQLLGPADIAARERDDWKGIPEFLERYRSELIARGRIDYGSLLVEAVRLLEDPTAGAAVGGAFRYVLVDEYQDTTPVQAQMAETIAAPHRNLTVAGDPYQSIYSFRGAELTNVAEFPDRYRDEAGEPALRIVLTTSFRVPAEVLAAATRITSGAGLPGAAGEVSPAPGSGSVEAYRFDQQSAEAEWIAAEIQRIHLRDHTPLERIGVLVRTKRRLLTELSRALDRRGIAHDRPDSRLADHPAVRPVFDLAAVAATRVDPPGLHRLLVGPFVGMTIGAAREVERTAARVGWDEALNALPAIHELLRDPAWATAMPAGEGFWHLWEALPELRDRAVQERETGMALASLAQALERLRERDPEVTLSEYAALSRSEDYEAEPLLSFEGGAADRVTLTTFHQAKGLEFDVVFIADAREGVFPDLRSRDSLLGARHLSSRELDDGGYLAFRLQEERRLAYTAMCRSRARVVWTFTRGARADAGDPSRFLTAALGVPAGEIHGPGAEGKPTTAAEAEAWLRRIGSDPTAPAGERLAALYLLATHPALLRPMSRFAGVLARGRDDGLLGDTPSLSPSQADAFDVCPRRYVFESRLKISDGGSLYAELGGLIHRVLEVAERAAVDRGEDHSSAEEAVAILEQEFDAADFGGPPWAGSWLERGRRIITHLYEFWPGRGPATGFESMVEYSLDGVRWRGRVDRAESRSGGIHIIDYKTGTRMLTKDEAETALQLGFYALASGPDIAGAEFWYPGIGPGRRKSVAVRSFAIERIDEVVDAMRRAQEGILSELWEPRTGDHCDRCPVRTLCPEWPEGREAYSQ